MPEEMTRAEALELCTRFIANTRWDELDSVRMREEVTCLAPEELGRRFTEFLKNGARVFVDKPTRLFVDRERAFDPCDFFGNGWRIWRGPLEGRGMTGKAYHYPSTRRGFGLDPKTLRLVTTLALVERCIYGFERHQRLALSRPGCLDANVFRVLWENPDVIPEEFKRDSDGEACQLCFDGTVLRNPLGRPRVIYMSFRNSWMYDTIDLAEVFGPSQPSMVNGIPPVPKEE